MSDVSCSYFFEIFMVYCGTEIEITEIVFLIVVAVL